MLVAEVINDSPNSTTASVPAKDAAGAASKLEITNAATSNAPQLAAAGSDANIDLDLQPKGTGDVVLGNYTLDGDQTVGAGQDNYLLTYDNGTGLISLEAAPPASLAGT